MKKKNKEARLVSPAKVVSVGIWSLAYTSVIYVFVLGVIGNIVVFIGWKALESVNAIQKLDEKIASVAGDGAFRFSEVVTQDRVLGVSVILTVVFVALAPLLAIILGGLYSAIAAFTGGVRINLEAVKVAPIEEIAISDPTQEDLHADDVDGRTDNTPGLA